MLGLYSVPQVATKGRLSPRAHMGRILPETRYEGVSGNLPVNADDFICADDDIRLTGRGLSDTGCNRKPYDQT